MSLQIADYPTAGADTAAGYTACLLCNVDSRKETLWSYRSSEGQGKPKAIYQVNISPFICLALPISDHDSRWLERWDHGFQTTSHKLVPPISLTRMLGIAVGGEVTQYRDFVYVPFRADFQVDIWCMNANRREGQGKKR